MTPFSDWYIRALNFIMNVYVGRTHCFADALTRNLFGSAFRYVTVAA